MGADEAAFEVGVDDAGGLRGGVAFVDGPSADFFDAGGEVGLQAQEVVARADQAVQAWLFQAHFGEEFGFFVVFQLGDFALHRGANGNDGGVFFFSQFFQAVEVRIVFKTVFGNVADIHGGFGGQQEQRFEHGEFFRVQTEGADRFAFVQMRQQFFAQLDQFLRVFVA